MEDVRPTLIFLEYISAVLIQVISALYIVLLMQLSAYAAVHSDVVAYAGSIPYDIFCSFILKLELKAFSVLF